MPRVSPCDSTDTKPIFKAVGWNPREDDIPVPPEGFRYVIADEVFPGCPTFTEMQSQVNEWGIMWLINGWTEGRSYHHPHGSTICDNGERLNDIGEVLMVNKEFPVIF